MSKLLPHETVPDGGFIESPQGFAIGNCEECGVSQHKLYVLGRCLYCLDCFPRVVNYRKAMEKLNAKPG